MPIDFCLAVIGEGHDAPRLHRMARRLNVESRVRFLGALEDDETARWMGSAFAGVSLSAKEAFGIFALEVLAAGKPVVVGPAPGFLDLAREFPNSVFPANVRDAPADIAGRILDSAEEFVPVDVSKYDWNRIAEMVGEVYSQVGT